MGKRKRNRMSFSDALDLVPDDMPDGAAFAMAHEIAGLEYGDGFDELAEEATGRATFSEPTAPPDKPWKCNLGCNKHFGSKGARKKHYRDKHHAGTAA